MGLVGVQEHGNREMGLSGISLGTKNKYKRMDSELSEDHNDPSHHHEEEDRGSSIRKYVFACAVFASLNNVLLGYGLLFSILALSQLFSFFPCFYFDYISFLYLYVLSFHCLLI